MLNLVFPAAGTPAPTQTAGANPASGAPGVFAGLVAVAGQAPAGSLGQKEAGGLALLSGGKGSAPETAELEGQTAGLDPALLGLPIAAPAQTVAGQAVSSAVSGASGALSLIETPAGTPGNASVATPNLAGLNTGTVEGVAAVSNTLQPAASVAAQSSGVPGPAETAVPAVKAGTTVTQPQPAAAQAIVQQQAGQGTPPVQALPAVVTTPDQAAPAAQNTAGTVAEAVVLAGQAPRSAVRANAPLSQATGRGQIQSEVAKPATATVPGALPVVEGTVVDDSTLEQTGDQPDVTPLLQAGKPSGQVPPAGPPPFLVREPAGGLDPLRTEAEGLRRVDVSFGPQGSLADRIDGAAPAQETARAAPPRPFTEALMAQVRSVEVSEGRTTVNLHPRGLGAIEIEVITERDAGSKVIVRVENPAVLNALREDRQMLAQAIGAGDGATLEFSDQAAGQQPGGERQSSSGNEDRPAFELAGTDGASSDHVNVVDDDQLDILT